MCSSHQRENDSVQARAAGHVEELGARVDHRAVGVTDGDRRDLPRLDRDHRLVEQRHALGERTEVDEHPALADARQGDEFPVAVPRADGARLNEQLVRTGEVAGPEDPAHRRGVREVAQLDTVDGGVVQQSTYTLDPPGTPADVALEPHRLRQAETEASRQLDLVGLRAVPVCLRPELEGGLVAARQVGGNGESIEVVDREVVEGHPGQEPVRLAPVVTLEGRLSVVDRSPHRVSIADATRSTAVSPGTHWLGSGPPAPTRWFC